MKNIKGNIIIEEKENDLIISTEISKEDLRRYLLENKLNNESIVFTDNTDKQNICYHNNGKQFCIEQYEGGKDNKVICSECGTVFKLVHINDIMTEKVQIDEVNLFDILNTVKCYTILKEYFNPHQLSIINKLLNGDLSLNIQTRHELFLILKMINNEVLKDYRFGYHSNPYHTYFNSNPNNFGGGGRYF